MAMWVIAGVIIAFAVVGQIMQTIKTRRSRQALASYVATAVLRGLTGSTSPRWTAMTCSSGKSRWCPARTGSPSGFEIWWIENIPAADYELQAGVTSVEWSGTTAQDMRIMLFPEVDDGAPVVAQ